MKTKLKFAFLSLMLATLSIGFLQRENNVLKASADESNIQTHQRVYVYVDNALNDWNNIPRIHYWGGTTTPATVWDDRPSMTQALGSDFYKGLYFYDLPIDITLFMVSSGESPNDWNKSIDIEVNSLFDDNFKLLKIIENHEQNGNRNVEFIDNHGINSGQFGAVLSHVDYCSSNYASGYNSWPQLVDLFRINDIEYDLSWSFKEMFGEENTTTIGHKLAMLEHNYLTKGAGSQNNAKHFIVEDNNSLAATIIIGVIGITTLAGYYFITKKSTLKV